MCYTQNRSGLIEPGIGLFLAAKDLRGPVLDQLGIPRPFGHLFHEHLPSMNWMEARAVLEQLDHSGFRELGQHSIPSTGTACHIIYKIIYCFYLN